MLIESAARSAVDDVIARACARVPATGSGPMPNRASSPGTPTGGDHADRLGRVGASGAAARRRVWELRRSLSSYDAAYVALAELAGATLVTLDRRIDRAPDLRCTVATP